LGAGLYFAPKSLFDILVEREATPPGMIAYTPTRAISEHGIFSASTSGVLLDRSIFESVDMMSGDVIQFTHAFTFTPE
jgi:hypothetical protein